MFTITRHVSLAVSEKFSGPWSRKPDGEAQSERLDIPTDLKRVQSLLRQPLLPEHSELGEAYPDVLVSEHREHKLFLKRARQQIGQIPQTLQTQLVAHVGGARQRVTATSSYNLVSSSYIRRELRELLRFAGKHEETITYGERGGRTCRCNLIGAT